jgi:hypothetical protein
MLGDFWSALAFAIRAGMSTPEVNSLVGVGAGWDNEGTGNSNNTTRKVLFFMGGLRS